MKKNLLKIALILVLVLTACIVPDFRRFPKNLVLRGRAAYSF